MNKTGFVYIMTNADRSVLYTGVTSNLYRRVWEHRNKIFPQSFTSRYKCFMLVYYMQFDQIESAIMEEKRLKGGSRKQKEDLISYQNKEWKDLWIGMESR